MFLLSLAASIACWRIRTISRRLILHVTTLYVHRKDLLVLWAYTSDTIAVGICMDWWSIVSQVTVVVQELITGYLITGCAAEQLADDSRSIAGASDRSKWRQSLAMGIMDGFCVSVHSLGWLFLVYGCWASPRSLCGRYGAMLRTACVYCVSRNNVHCLFHRFDVRAGAACSILEAELMSLRSVGSSSWLSTLRSGTICRRMWRLPTQRLKICSRLFSGR